jgi:hypothetical protein
MPRDFSTDATLRPDTRNSGYPRHSGYVYVDKGFYVEPRWVVRLLLDVEVFTGSVLDPCCGTGTIPSVCMERGIIHAAGSDIVDRGFGTVCDLFDITEPMDNIISNVTLQHRRRMRSACSRWHVTRWL